VLFQTLGQVAHVLFLPGLDDHAIFEELPVADPATQVRDAEPLFAHQHPGIPEHQNALCLVTSPVLYVFLAADRLSAAFFAGDPPGSREGDGNFFPGRSSQ
jgi:hypothetical protein